MKNKLILKVLTLSLCSILIFSACASSGDESQAERENTATTAQPETTNTTSSQDGNGTKPGVYTDYSEAALASAQQSGDTVLFFHAQWCSVCKGIEKDIKANLTNIPTDLTILQVDYDSATELKQRYGVRQQYTMVQVDEDGKKIALWNDSYTLEDIVNSVA